MLYHPSIHNLSGKFFTPRVAARLGLRFTAAVGLGLVAGCGVYEVVPAGKPSLEAKGASYNLPRTVIVANVPIKDTMTEKGEFSDYALPLLRLRPNYTGKEHSFAVGEEISLEASSEKDPDQRFIAVNPRGPLHTYTQTLNLNEQGVLTKGEVSVENKTVEFTVSTLEAAAKIAGSVIAFAGAEDALFPERVGLGDLCDHLNSFDPDAQPKLTLPGLRAGLQILLAANPDNALEQLKTQPENQAAAKNWEAFTDKHAKGCNEITRAVTAYADLVKLNSLKDLAKAPADRAAFDAQRTTILARFLGTKSERTWIGQFRWVPPNRDARVTAGTVPASQQLFVLWSNRGVPQFDYPPEAPPSPTLTGGKKSGEKALVVKLVCESTVPPQTPAWQSLLGQEGRHGWHYRIPAQARVNLYVGKESRAMKRLDVAQHGCVAFLPATSSSQKVTSNVDLDPLTGALRGITQGGQAYDPALISRSGAAVAGVIDAESAHEKAEAAANDPVVQLTRKKNILQLQKDIQALQAPSPAP